MSNIKEREKFDNYEIEDEYDFTDAIRGRFYEPKKIPLSLRIDNVSTKWTFVLNAYLNGYSLLGV
jgi:hypothetical protein